MGKRSSSAVEEDEGHRKRQHLATNSTETLSKIIPDPASVRWNLSEIKPDLPPLPPIPDAHLETAAFTHPGTGYGANYELLEWYGDAVIEMAATDLIYETFGDQLPAGRCNQIREQLVRNIQLAVYYRQYKMEKRTRLPTDMPSMEELINTRPRDKEVTKIQGDVFEAYVGAVVRADRVNGLKVVQTWLKTLWGQTIKDQIQQAEENRKPASNGAEPGTVVPSTKKGLTPKELLARNITVKGIRIRYEDIPCHKKDPQLNLPLFVIGVYLDGWGETNKLLGTGTALKKTEAGQKAAAQALENRELIKVLGDKKKAFMEAQRAAEEKGVVGV